MVRLGNIKLSIETESDSRSIDATTYPVERSESYTDHVITKPKEFSLSGQIDGPNYMRDKQYLENEMNKGTVFTYVGRNIAKQVIILSIDGTAHVGIMNGSEINIKLQTVRFATSPWKSVNNTGEKKPVVKAAESTNEVYHVTKSGDTYWGLWKKYGTSIDQLRKWNKYPDRRIPIGVKLRVK